MILNSVAPGMQSATAQPDENIQDRGIGQELRAIASLQQRESGAGDGGAGGLPQSRSSIHTPLDPPASHPPPPSEALGKQPQELSGSGVRFDMSRFNTGEGLFRAAADPSSVEDKSTQQEAATVPKSSAWMMLAKARSNKVKPTGAGAPCSRG